jgi:lipopolysaccharide transport system ATP-binding protein
MSQIVIRVDDLSKRYRVGERERYLALRDVLMNSLKGLLGSVGQRQRLDYFWALHHISLDVRQGEVIGLVGRNGAGKTTLLKILSRITRPTAGCAELHGRVASLLEVGTGFHPELTGRENVYLSGAVLGMKNVEIRQKFDAIVDFAEVGRFIDTPLKHFSTGMQMRLAFAVAAHLEPEILLVDEVLAVGDLEFQKKCLGKMQDVSNSGRTIVFVSHNLTAVNALCRRSVLIENGEVVMDGSTSQIIAAYHLRSSEGLSDRNNLSKRKRTGTGTAIFAALSLQPLDSNGNRASLTRTGSDLVIEVVIEARSELVDSNVAITIYDGSGYRLVDINLNQKGEFLRLRSAEKARVKFLVRQLFLKPGAYLLGLWLGRNNIEEIDSIPYAASLEIAPESETGVHSVEFPGPYQCRFETSISCFEESRAR